MSGEATVFRSVGEGLAEGATRRAPVPCAGANYAREP